MSRTSTATDATTARPQTATSAAPPPLFRPEALAHQRVRLWGTVMVRQPPLLLLASVLLAVVIACAAAALWFGEYHRKERVPGVLRASRDDTTVRAEAAGVVTALWAQPGAVVRAGQPLLRLRRIAQLPDGRTSEEALLAEADLALAGLDREVNRERERARLEAERLGLREQGLRERDARLAQALAQARELTALAAAQRARLDALAGQGGIAPVQRDLARGEHLERLAAESLLQRERGELQQERAQLHLEARRLPLDGAGRLAHLAQQRAQLAERRIHASAARGTVIAAPFAGRIGDVYVRAGEAVRAEHGLLSLTAGAQRLEALLLVPSRAAGFMRPGQQVRLRLDAFPYQRFGTQLATIRVIDAVLALPGDGDLPVRVSEPVLRVRARLHRDAVLAYGQAVPLRAGLLFDADVLLERRTLWQWLIDPLRAQLGK